MQTQRPGAPTTNIYLRQGHFSDGAFVELGCGQLSQLVMVGNEIFIDANVSFGIQPLSQNNCEELFLFKLQSFIFYT